jgi:hypothetical protein
LKIKNLQTSQTRNGGKFDEPPKKQFGRTGLILLFAEKLPALLKAGRDEHFLAGILTPGIKPCSGLPAFSRSGLLELVARHSGATVPEFHGVPWSPKNVLTGHFDRLCQRAFLECHYHRGFDNIKVCDD